MDTLPVLQFLIYFVFVFSIVAYATLDGFDIGVGCLHLFAKTDQERRIMINAIGPVWDGNTTWIVIGGGVLFAGFPKAFATLMGGFYTPIMMMMFGFMLRGAAIEFRSKKEGKAWRNLWDRAFFFASLLLALSLGVSLGNLAQGLPLNGKLEFEGGLSALFRPYPLLVGVFALSLFMMHGSIYLLMKTEGALHNHFRKWVKRLVAVFLIMWAITTFFTIYDKPHMIQPIFKHPILGIFALLSALSIAAVPKALSKGNDGWAFVASSGAIVSLLILYIIGTFPYLAFSSIDPAYSLTFMNSSSTELTLIVLTIISLTGIPLSFFYGSYLYKVFKGKIRLDSTSY